MEMLDGGSQRWRRVRPLVVSAVVLVGAAAVSACGDGGGSSPSQAELNAARKEGQQQARQQQQIKDLQQQLEDVEGDDEDSTDGSTTTTGSSSSGGSAAPFAGGTDCGQGIVAGPNTSCAFAINVAGDFNSSGQPSQVDTYSPTTGQTYTMTCIAGQPNVCRGGNNASVAFP